MKKNKSGFTLIELLVVIAIIGLLSTLSILALNQARARARDAKRIADVRQIQTALELYYNDKGDYPGSATTTMTTALKPYLATIPKAPSIADGSTDACATASTKYDYEKQGATQATASYTIKYCLGSDVNDVEGGKVQIASPAGIASE